jgi:hypothetical protein
MARFSFEIARDFDVSTPLQLKTRISDGRVRIQGHDAAKATIAVRLQVRAASREEAETQVDRVVAGIVCTGETLSIESPDAGFWRHGDIRALYEILVPRQTRAELRLANGPLHLTNLAGPLEVHLDNGPMTIEGITEATSVHIVNGPLDVKDCESGVDISVVNGPLRVRKAKGPVTLDVTNGPIYVEDVDLGLKARVLNGVLTYRGPVGGDFDLTANNASLVLHLPWGSRFELDAEAQRGSVESDFQVDEGAPAPDGAHHLRLRAVQGNIRIAEIRRGAFAFA